jgi:hypothetical protein
MKALIASLFLFALASGAQARCYAEYKAKQDDPLRLHYGVALLADGACPTPQDAAQRLRPRLETAGWTLLDVVGLSDRPPGDQKKANAGDYYLRF